MSDFGAGSRGGGKKGGPGKAPDPNVSTWDAWRSQGLPIPPIYRKLAGGRLHDAGWVVGRIQRHLELHPEAPPSAGAVQRKGEGEAAGGVKIPNGGGAPLPGGVQAKMQSKLGADLSDVRVHTSGDSAKASEGLNAQAFTVGSDVHFNAGKFDPGSKDGEKLLAHELTHVAQNKAGGVQRKEDAEGDSVEGAEGEQLEVSDPNEPAEQEADAKSEEVVNDDEGAPAPNAADSPTEQSSDVSTKLFLKPAKPPAKPAKPAAPAGAAGKAGPKASTKVPFKTADGKHGTEKVAVKLVGDIGALLINGEEGGKALDPLVTGGIGNAKNQAGMGCVAAAQKALDAGHKAAQKIKKDTNGVEPSDNDNAKTIAEAAKAAIDTLQSKIKGKSDGKLSTCVKPKNLDDPPAALQFDKPPSDAYDSEYLGKFTKECNRQLKLQQEGINALTLDDWVINVQKYNPRDDLPEMDKNAKMVVLEALKERAKTYKQAAETRKENLKQRAADAKAKVDSILAQGKNPAKTKDEYDAIRAKQQTNADDLAAIIDGDAEVKKGLKEKGFDTASLAALGGRDDNLSSWRKTHQKALDHIFETAKQWQGLVESVSELVVLHNPDQISGGEGKIEKVEKFEDFTSEDGKKYIASIKAQLGVHGINSSLGPQWTTKIDDLYSDVTGKHAPELYGIRKMKVSLTY